MFGPINLSSFIKQNLLSLENTSALIDRNQVRLATGNKVNNAIDDPSAFYNAESLRNRGADFLNAKDAIGYAAGTVKAGIDALASISDVIEQMRGLAQQVASQSASPGILGPQFAELRSQIDRIVNDASFHGVNIVNNSNLLKINFDEDAASEQTITGTTNAASGLALNTSSVANFILASLAVTALTTALSSVRTRSIALGSNASFLEVLTDFTNRYVNGLKDGADRLTVADVNEDSTTATLLNTRKQIGVEALSLAAQSEQEIVKLFG